MNSGMVFDVERFATKDGPGIRTVVFMKGCNMRCGWCHNPEGMSFRAELLYDERKCIGCGMCMESCPAGVHVMCSGLHAFDRSLCVGCMRCTEVCCSGALQRVGREYRVDALMDILMQDALYYKNSGGGVTVSGGEPLCQAEFVDELLQALCEAGVHTALETNLSQSWEKLERVLKYTRLLMFDIKHIDEQTHYRHTGISLKTVLDNARRVEKTGIPAIARTPVVPGVNDDAETIRGIAEFLKETFGAGLQYYELLTYHPMGTDKAVKLGAEKRTQPLAALTPEHMRGLVRAAAKYGIQVRLDGTRLEN